MQQTRLLYQQMVHNEFDPSYRPGLPNSAHSTAHLPDESTQMLAQNALHKLADLQETIEKTAVELRQIERLINQALLNSHQL